MRLLDWMKKTNTDVIEAAEAFGVSVFAVKKWLRDERNPRDAMKLKIKQVTKGMVTPNDWVK